ncbi:MAG TPA: sulfite exporter TauE/SafE family protein [Rhizomicrobium sp.]|jgi:hypothetical protein
MMQFLQHLDPLYVLSGVLVGGLVGMTGVGGGSMMTPLLILVFGVPPATAVGTDLFYAGITNIAGALVHGSNKTVDWRIVWRLALGSVPATALMILLLYLLKADSNVARALITKVLGLALLFTAVLLIFRKPIMKWHAEHVGDLPPKTQSRLTTLTGAVVGVLVTLSSVGAGAIGVTVLVMLYPKMMPRRIVGSDIAHAVPLALLAGFGHSFLGAVDLSMLTSLLAGSIPAIIVMSIVSARASDTAMRVALAAVLIVVCVRFWFF